MAEESIIQFTFAIDDPEMEEERRQKIAQKLLGELKNLDEVERAERVENLNPESGSKPGLTTLIGVLRAKVKFKNIKDVLGFVGERLGDKPITVNVKVGQKEVNIKAKSRKELLEGERVAKELLAAMGAGENG